MTFDEFWRAKGIKASGCISPILEAAIKELCRQAWDASRNCPKCGKDLRWSSCRYCPTPDFGSVLSD